MATGVPQRAGAPGRKRGPNAGSEARRATPNRPQDRRTERPIRPVTRSDKMRAQRLCVLCLPSNPRSHDRPSCPPARRQRTCSAGRPSPLGACSTSCLRAGRPARPALPPALRAAGAPGSLVGAPLPLPLGLLIGHRAASARPTDVARRPGAASGGNSSADSSAIFAGRRAGTALAGYGHRSHTRPVGGFLGTGAADRHPDPGPLLGRLGAARPPARVRGADPVPQGRPVRSLPAERDRGVAPCHPAGAMAVDRVLISRRTGCGRPGRRPGAASWASRGCTGSRTAWRRRGRGARRRPSAGHRWPASAWRWCGAGRGR